MVNIEAFKAHMRGMKPPAVTAPEPDGDEAGPDLDNDGDGLSPGDQALKAIEAKDGAAFEAAIARCMDKYK